MLTKIDQNAKYVIETERILTAEHEKMLLEHCRKSGLNVLCILQGMTVRKEVFVPQKFSPVIFYLIGGLGVACAASAFIYRFFFMYR